MDIDIKNFPLFFLLNKRESKHIIIKNNKSIKNGEILNGLDTVIVRKIKPFIKLEAIKNTSNKWSSLMILNISFNFLFNFFIFIDITYANYNIKIKKCEINHIIFL